MVGPAKTEEGSLHPLHDVCDVISLIYPPLKIHLFLRENVMRSEEPKIGANLALSSFLQYILKLLKEMRI